MCVYVCVHVCMRACVCVRANEDSYKDEMSIDTETKVFIFRCKCGKAAAAHDAVEKMQKNKDKGTAFLGHVFHGKTFGKQKSH